MTTPNADSVLVEGMILGSGPPQWTPSKNTGAKDLLEDSDAVSVTITYDDGSQVIFRRAHIDSSGADA